MTQTVFDNAYDFYYFAHDKTILLENSNLKQLIDWCRELRSGNCNCNMKYQSMQVGELYARIGTWLTPENQIEIKVLTNTDKIIIKHFGQEIMVF